MSSLSKHLIICTSLFVFCLSFFLYNIEYPNHLNFDETAYVPVANQFLKLRSIGNLEHPPLGKMLISIGIAIWGDQPLGWRFMSAIFGAVTCVSMYLWALAIFGDGAIALWVALLTLVNQLLYVMARIGLLDVFMFAFVAIAMAAFSAWWMGDQQTRRDRLLLLVSGIALGLATACKWFGPIPWAICLGLAFFQRHRISVRDLVLFLIVTPLVTYFLTFTPFLFLSDRSYTLGEILQLQARMWTDNTHLTQPHGYMSSWPGWPIMKRPIWFAYDPEAGNPGFVRNVILLGNPLIIWGGLLAVPYCLWAAVIKRRREAILIVTFYLGFYLSWAVIPRRVSFFYYYYPAAMTLGFILAYTLKNLCPPQYRTRVKWTFLGAAALLFVYFFPVLSAIKVPISVEVNRMWFRSWI